MGRDAKKIILIILIVLAVAIAVNYFAGTSIVINGRQASGLGGFIGAYLALVLIAGILVIIIPSVLILILLLAILFGIFMLLFFPLLPIALLLLPGVIFAGIVYLIYRLLRKRK